MTDDYTQEYAALFADVAATGRRLNRDEIERRRESGEQAAREGHALRGLIRGHLTAVRSAWPEQPLTRRTTLDLLTAVEQSVDAFSTGFERAQRLAVRQEEAERREFIDDLLYGRSDLGRTAERAERFGLRLSQAHAVAVARGPKAYTEADAVPQQVERAMIGRFGDRHILLTTKGGRMVCVAPGDQTEILSYFAKQAFAATGGGQAAIGRTQPGPRGVVHSYEEALGALDLADRLGLDAPVLHAADLLVYPVLTRDRQAMEDLVRTTLGPLSSSRGGAEPLLDTLIAYFDSGCVTTQTARDLNLSVRAVTYRLARIHRLTGTDPADPASRYTLQTAVIGARLLGWPAKQF
ncbi:helix-turn-helix domain-containing protein [Streptomyces sp. CC208A]|uniref:PucR family transcriptional regulator n=1 Tax=Streptomyces sp. CC208A TaxID=3044573 RepID=UPI0024A8BF62|nr:helix-turn-helix domain-containing protein [Streptomyces sp. CC208A]